MENDFTVSICVSATTVFRSSRGIRTWPQRQSGQAFALRSHYVVAHLPRRPRTDFHRFIYTRVDIFCGVRSGPTTTSGSCELSISCTFTAMPVQRVRRWALVATMSTLLFHCWRLNRAAAECKYTSCHMTALYRCSLEACVNYTKMDLRDQQLSGTIPATLTQLTWVTYFDIGGNALTSTIPASLGLALPNVTFFDIAQNRLTGSLPPSIGSLAAVMTLRVSQNKITGTVPSSLASLRLVKGFSVGYNQFTGTLPRSLASLQNIENFNVCNNSLTGQLPPRLDSLDHLVGLTVSNNRFNSTLSASLCGVMSNATQNCDLSGNPFACPLPCPDVASGQCHATCVTPTTPTTAPPPTTTTTSRAGPSFVDWILVTAGVVLVIAVVAATAAYCWREHMVLNKRNKRMPDTTTGGERRRPLL